MWISLQWSQEFSGVPGDLPPWRSDLRQTPLKLFQAKSANGAAGVAHPTENVAATIFIFVAAPPCAISRIPKNCKPRSLFEEAIKKQQLCAAYAGTADASRIMYHEKKG